MHITPKFSGVYTTQPQAGRFLKVQSGDDVFFVNNDARGKDYHWGRKIIAAQKRQAEADAANNTQAALVESVILFGLFDSVRRRSQGEWTAAE